MSNLHWVDAVFLLRRIRVDLPITPPLGNTELVNHAIPFCTNVMISFGKEPTDSVDRFDLLNRLVPDVEIVTILNLYNIELMHEFFQYRLNTQIRSFGEGIEGLQVLIESCNRRSGRAQKRTIKRGRLKQGFVLTHVSVTRSDGKSIFHVFNGSSGFSARIACGNYVLFCSDLSEFATLCQNLDIGAFEDGVGMPYLNWINIYRTTNAIIAGQLISQATPKTLASMSKRDFLNAVEKEGDYSQAGVAIINRESCANHALVSRVHLFPSV